MRHTPLNSSSITTTLGWECRAELRFWEVLIARGWGSHKALSRPGTEGGMPLLVDSMVHLRAVCKVQVVLLGEPLRYAIGGIGIPGL